VSGEQMNDHMVYVVWHIYK